MTETKVEDGLPWHPDEKFREPPKCCSLEELLDLEGLFYLSHRVKKLLNLPNHFMPRFLAEMEASRMGQTLYKAFGFTRFEGRKVVRMKVFGPYYRKAIHPMRRNLKEQVMRVTLFLILSLMPLGSTQAGVQIPDRVTITVARDGSLFTGEVIVYLYCNKEITPETEHKYFARNGVVSFLPPAHDGYLSMQICGTGFPVATYYDQIYQSKTGKHTEYNFKPGRSKIEKNQPLTLQMDTSRKKYPLLPNDDGTYTASFPASEGDVYFISAGRADVSSGTLVRGADEVTFKPPGQVWRGIGDGPVLRSRSNDEADFLAFKENVAKWRAELIIKDRPDKADLAFIKKQVSAELLPETRVAMWKRVLISGYFADWDPVWAARYAPEREALFARLLQQPNLGRTLPIPLHKLRRGDSSRLPLLHQLSEDTSLPLESRLYFMWDRYILTKEINPDQALHFATVLRDNAPVNHDFYEVASLYIKQAAMMGNAPPAIRGLHFPDYLGQYVVVDFWATWCRPCLGALSDLIELETPRPVTLVNIEISGNQKRLVKIKKSLPGFGVDTADKRWVSLSETGDWNAPSAQSWRVHFLPATFIVSPAGKIVASGDQIRRAGGLIGWFQEQAQW